MHKSGTFGSATSPERGITMLRTLRLCVSVMVVLAIGHGCSTADDAGTDTADDAGTDTADDADTATAGEGDGAMDAAGEMDDSGTEDGAAEGSDACDEAQLEAGEHYLTVENDGREREYLLVVPEAAATGTKTPLVVNLHGYTGSMDIQRILSTQDTEENFEAFGYIVAYPNGLGSSQSWNAGDCCGEAYENNEDDVGFIRAMVEEVSERVCVDEKRVFAFGIANGAFMANRLGCEASDLFAAVGALLGTLFLDPERCDPFRPVPIMLINGTEDPFVAYEGGKASTDLVDVDYPRSVPDTFIIWAEKNSCQGDPVVSEEVGTTTCETYDDCDASAEVTLCTIVGMGHCWPGQSTCLPDFGEPSTDINANKTIREFFERFAMPE